MLKRAAAALLIALAVMVLSHLTQGSGPSARAQPYDDPAKVDPNSRCEPGDLGCYYCNGNSSPGGAGCDNGNIGSWTFGSCSPGNKNEICSHTSHDCGNYRNCTTNVIVGQCLTLPICINGIVMDP